MMGKNSELYHQEKYALTHPEEHQVVEGNVMCQKHWQAVNAFIETGVYQRAAEAASVHRETIYEWRKQKWWKKLVDEFITSKQEELQVRIAQKDDDLLNAYEEVITGADKGDRTASARVNAMRMRMEMGENPLIKKNNGVYPPFQVQINNVALDFDKIQQLSADKISEIARTGQVPKELRGEKE